MDINLPFVKENRPFYLVLILNVGTRDFQSCCRSRVGNFRNHVRNFRNLRQLYNFFQILDRDIKSIG